MSEYISREAAYSLAKKVCNAVDSNQRVLLPRIILDLIDDLPAADVRPVTLCRDCKFAPIGDKNGSDLEWPFNEFDENPCPYKCMDCINKATVVIPSDMPTYEAEEGE